MEPWPEHISVKGAGAASINGVFKMQGITHEGCPVYGSLNGFSLSACQCPDDSGKALWGWIIGQAGVAAYGGVTSQKEVIPLTAWQCFEGPQPAPRLHLVNADAWRKRASCYTWAQDSLAEAYLEEARWRGSSDMVSIKARPW